MWNSKVLYCVPVATVPLRAAGQISQSVNFTSTAGLSHVLVVVTRDTYVDLSTLIVSHSHYLWTLIYASCELFHPKPVNCVRHWKFYHQWFVSIPSLLCPTGACGGLSSSTLYPESSLAWLLDHLPPAPPLKQVSLFCAVTEIANHGYCRYWSDKSRH